MKLSPESVTQLDSLLKIANIVKIDVLTIKDGLISGIDEEKSVVLMSNQSVPDLNGLQIGINRLGSLSKHMKLFSVEDMKIEATTSPRPNRENQIFELLISSKKSKIKFRTANVDKCRTPKNLNDAPIWMIVLPHEEIDGILKAASTMGTENVIITSKNGEIFFEFIDEDSSDSYSTSVTSELSWIPEDVEAPSNSFVYYYRLQSLMPILKTAALKKEDIPLLIGAKGMLQIDLGDYTFTVLNRKGA